MPPEPAPSDDPVRRAVARWQGGRDARAGDDPADGGAEVPADGRADAAAASAPPDETPAPSAAHLESPESDVGPVVLRARRRREPSWLAAARRAVPWLTDARLEAALVYLGGATLGLLLAALLGYQEVVRAFLRLRDLSVFGGLLWIEVGALAGAGLGAGCARLALSYRRTAAGPDGHLLRVVPAARHPRAWEARLGLGLALCAAPALVAATWAWDEHDWSPGAALWWVHVLYGFGLAGVLLALGRRTPPLDLEVPGAHRLASRALLGVVLGAGAAFVVYTLVTRYGERRWRSTFASALVLRGRRAWVASLAVGEALVAWVRPARRWIPLAFAAVLVAPVCVAALGWVDGLASAGDVRDAWSGMLRMLETLAADRDAGGLLAGACLLGVPLLALGAVRTGLVPYARERGRWPVVAQVPWALTAGLTAFSGGALLAGARHVSWSDVAYFLPLAAIPPLLYLAERLEALVVFRWERRALRS